MPYKDSERKRQWELAHRQQRAERRRVQRAPQPRKTTNSQIQTSWVPDRAFRKERKPKGWVFFLLVTGIVFGLPILFARSGSGQ
jgi:hypothetical protein